MRVVKIVLGIIGLVVAVAGGFATFLPAGQKSGLKLAINDVDMTKVADGGHRGSHKARRWSNTVEVTVAGHKIQRVEVVDDVVYGDPKTTAPLLERVIQEQTLEVDVITGATITSKAYLKSIENALKDAK